ncbi:hypothetical protein BMF94_1853 [Rhodotorula taiwanensis]|uniref:Aprataxin C2HE/C2H2/C2HC zinc finger domain-containing protein n=1 Tax=Rhodotorula taiwanensis TaxID=741276 RepID=A0A2S5BEN9_9BASI|nr:hypothetical protein BMF94_1853 [Rhodotorula taiwanensis]
MSWLKVLENYAKLKDPQKELPAGVWVTSDEHTTTIFDGFEKAKYHLLILPRHPFRLEDGSILPLKSLESLSHLAKSPHALQVLRALQKQADEVQEMIRDEMEKEEGFAWDVESMRHVHLHVISTDFVSPKLKNKKHWNSFRPDLGYFLQLSDVIAALERGQSPFDRTPKEYEELLKAELVSSYPPHQTFATLPKLKDHLEDEWRSLRRIAKKEP